MNKVFFEFILRPKTKEKKLLVFGYKSTVLGARQYNFCCCCDCIRIQQRLYVIYLAYNLQQNKLKKLRLNAFKNINRSLLVELNFIQVVTVILNRNYNTTITYCMSSKAMRTVIYLYN